MGHDRETTGQPPLEAGRSAWIETFRSRSRRDLRRAWTRSGASPSELFIDEPWGEKHRPDWAERGLLIWPRGRQWLRLEHWLAVPEDWSGLRHSTARLCLSWWAEAMRLWVDGVLVHEALGFVIQREGTKSESKLEGNGGRGMAGSMVTWSA